MLCVRYFIIFSSLSWHGRAATTPPKPEERPLSAQEEAEKARWDSLSEEERKAELDAILRG